jgi:tetratricopeptide (TPR) repeat protein
MLDHKSEPSNPSPPEFVGGRYRINSVLGRGGMGTVYRANDLLGGSVALKRLHLSVEELSRDMTRTAGQTSTAAGKVALSLAHEFRTLSSLRHPNVISVLDYGFDAEHRPYLTMELLDRAQTFVAAAKDKPYAVRLQLLTQVLQALVYLHRRGVIHRDLKPANILVVEDRVKVLDFGISLAREEWKNQELASDAGTPGYVAPELLRGESPSEVSDLYSFGLMAAQLLSAKPLTERTPQLLLAAIEEPAVARVLARLLEPDPRARYTSAEEVIAALREATGHALETETAATRESFLQAARYVGREEERKSLEHALDEALEGSGGAWLIGGESGIGKSRLSERIRAYAQVKGALVLRGQSVSTGGSPYQVWRSVLRWMPLLTTLDDVEAGVLKPLVPDIEKLVGREVPAPPPLNADMARHRLLDTIEALLTRLEHPVMVLLEDVHWEATDSLALLARVVKRVNGLRMLILATYRSEERPDLPRELPGMEVLKLARLNAEEIAQLSESMLGKAGRQPHLLQRLQHETEGNPFFLVEVVRALAEETGRLDQIGEATLPGKSLSGGMQDVLRRRLQQVPESARALLDLAAILGREIDVAALQASDPTADVGAWVRTCANVAVLETLDGRWRFAHDKLREGQRELLPRERLPALHRRAAEALEAAHPQDPAHAAALAHHWRQAGDAQKEAFYSERVGEDALRLYGAAQEALPYLVRARELVASASSPEAFRLGRLELLLADTYLRVGDLRKCEESALRSMTHYGMRVPSSAKASQLWALLREGVVRFHQVTRLEPWNEPAPQEREARLKLGEALVLLADTYYYLNRRENLLWACLKALNVCEPVGPSSVLARAYSYLALAIPVRSELLRSLAETFCAHADETIRQVGPPAAQAYVFIRTGVSNLQRTRWKEALRSGDEALRLIPNHRDSRLADETHGLLGQSYMYPGRVRHALSVLDKMVESARSRGDRQIESWAVLLKSVSLVRSGLLTEAIGLLEPEMATLAGEGLVINQMIAHANLGLAYLHRGEPERARELGMRAAGWLDDSRPVSHLVFFGEVAAVELLSRVLEHHSSALEAQARRELRAAAEQACRALEACAKIFIVAGPAALLWRGTLERLAGQQRAAHRRYKQALAEAQRLTMPYVEAQIRLELGRILPPTDSARREHLTRAAELLRELECTPDLAEAEAALAASTA